MSGRPFSDRPTPSVPARVFITGADGFIGRALGDRLRELGAEVTGVDLRANPERGVIAGSTTDPDAWASALEGVDTIIHTAAVVSMVAPYDQAWEVNVLGTRKVLDAAIQAGVRRFVHLSSVAAFGFTFPDGVAEDFPAHGTGGVSSYHDTKINSEAVVLAAHAAGEIEVTVIRPTDVYGPGSVWVREPLAVIKAKQMILPNGGRGVFHVVYIDNFVDGVVLACTSEAASGQIFTIGDEAGISCGDYFGWLAALAGGGVRTLPTGIAVRLASTLGAVQRRLGQHSELGAPTMLLLNRSGGYSISKARRLLGTDPAVSWEQGKARTEEWIRSEGLLDAGA
jgi:nucleoside-diphosphate-sugar epimerase